MENFDQTKKELRLRDISQEAAYVAGFIRRVREEAGLSQAQLAKRMGKAPGYVARLERNGSKVKFDDLLFVADAVGRSRKELLAEIQKGYSERFGNREDAP